MIEVPAAALSIRLFLKYFDFISIGTNDLIQYTLALQDVSNGEGVNRATLSVKLEHCLEDEAMSGLVERVG